MTLAVPSVTSELAPVSPGARAAARFTAVALMAVAGLVLVATGIAISLAAGFVDRGAVVASSTDVAAIRALAPIVPFIGLFGVAHAIAAVGMVVGNRTASGLALGLAAVDVVAGILILFGSALSTNPAIDGAAIGATVIIGAVILAVAIRAADAPSDATLDA